MLYTLVNVALQASKHQVVRIEAHLNKSLNYQTTALALYGAYEGSTLPPLLLQECMVCLQLRSRSIGEHALDWEMFRRWHDGCSIAFNERLSREDRAMEDGLPGLANIWMTNQMAGYNFGSSYAFPA
uniref:Uncharacterized protein n=1 Tax=Setaria viridis TaxID=4556 RepID=A0A4U6T2A2_SETVI|nr:hypothetical protein SEVIR_9G266350v2 [Setaria viridis]